MTTSMQWLLATWTSRTPARHRRRGGALRPRASGDRGEGVISVAIAVLIMAFLGAAMWIGFQAMWTNTSEKTNSQIERIGDENP